jgi:Bacterial Ig domain/Secretion system C-terminal sorting domain
MRKFCLIAFLIATQLTLQAQTLTPPFTENFNSSTLTTNGWLVPTPGIVHDLKWYADAGDTLANGTPTGGLRMKLNSNTNFLASPGINLLAGKTYTAFFKEKVQGNPTGRKMKVGYNTTRSMIGATIFYDFACPNNIYTQLGFIAQTPTFSVPSSGIYYLVYQFYNADGSFSYVFSYLDDMGVEETVFPAVTVNSPANNYSKNEDYIDSTKIMIDVSASDADGTISKVEYFYNDTKLGESTTAPYQFLWKDANPGNYKVYAKATDNRNNVKVSDTSYITVKFRNGTLTPYVQWDYDVDNPNGSGLNYWQFPNGSTTAQYTLNSYFRGSQCLYINAVQGPTNYAISPSFSLKAGTNYNLEFLANTRGGEKVFKFMYTKTASLADTISIDTTRLRGIAPAAVPEFDYIRSKAFTVPTDGVYNIVIYYPINHPFNAGATGNLKSKFDQIRVLGEDLNNGPTAKLTYPTTGLTYAENASITFAADVKDIDGTISKVEYYANGVKVAESSTTPFSATWVNAPIGNIEVYAKAFDNSGAYGISPSTTVTGMANQFKTTSFLGTAGNDEIRGAVIKENNDIVFAGNIGNITVANTVAKYYVNGATDATAGAVVIMASDGKTIKSITRVCTKISDLTKDRNDNLYIAAVGDGVIKLNATATTMIYQRPAAAGKFVQRIDAGPKGNTAILEVSESNIDDGTLTGGNVTLINKDGVTLATCGSISQFTSDVCVDEATQTVVGTGFKNFNTTDLEGTSPLPVYVPVLRGFSFTGAQKWVDYNWTQNTTDLGPSPAPQWLNMLDNNMADARLNRCTIGKDGKLYILGQVYGGNHCFRYDAKDITLPGKMATGGDFYFNLTNTGTETHAVFGRYEPATGVVMRTQTFTARLPNGKGNSLIVEHGNIDADELGNVYVTGTSAFGMPMSLEYQPGDYTGGGFILKTNYSMNSRTISIRFSTGGYGKALAVKKANQFAYGGFTNVNYMYVSNAVQTTSGGANDAILAVINDNSCTLPNSATTIAPASYNVSTLAANNLFVDNNCKPIATVLPQGITNAVSDSVRVKLWVDATQNIGYVKRHFEITPYDDNGNPLANANTKTATVTLYFTQDEFDAYNMLNSAKLPIDENDAIGKANVLIDKYAGITNDALLGTPQTYTNGLQTINPDDAAIVYNAAEARWEISFAVNGFSGFFLRTASGVLASTIISFTGVKNAGTINLQWQTTNEIAVKHYEVLQSNDGAAFTTIEIATAKNNINKNEYNAVDKSTWLTNTKYYRLKIVNQDGSVTYSSILKFTNANDKNISVYPNPAKSNIVVSGMKGDGVIQIFALDGRLIEQRKVKVQALDIDVSNYINGTYILKYINEDGIKQTKIIKY